MILALDLGAPWFRMKAQPSLAFRFPLSVQVVGHGIGKPERHEINSAILLPMWQAIRREANVCVRIEEAQFGHGDLIV